MAEISEGEAVWHNTCYTYHRKFIHKASRLPLESRDWLLMTAKSMCDTRDGMVRKNKAESLVHRCMNSRVISARCPHQDKAEEGGDAGASSTDDNAVLGWTASADCSRIYALGY